MQMNIIQEIQAANQDILAYLLLAHVITERDTTWAPYMKGMSKALEVIRVQDHSGQWDILKNPDSTQEQVAAAGESILLSFM